MPELPEVETIARGLKSNLIGRFITTIELPGRAVFEERPTDFRRRLEKRQVESIDRHGKALFFTLKAVDAPAEDRVFLKVHLGMTGQLLWEPSQAPVQTHTHVVFHLNDGQDLRYRDIRRFGYLEIVDETKLGSSVPDAWLADSSVVFQALRKKKGFIKHALLNQHVIAGLGNIYVDEALYKSKIHPLRKMEDLSTEKIEELCLSIRNVLKRSIDVGGTSFRNYVDINGSRGGFKSRLFVYGREGNKCLICNATIQKKVIAGRGTHFCPRCQRPPRS
jgi:formamidopyrimidine-DNA glycosylase